jgi:hypothetical protein
MPIPPILHAPLHRIPGVDLHTGDQRTRHRQTSNNHPLASGLRD